MIGRYFVPAFLALMLVARVSLADQFVQRSGPVIEGSAVEQDEARFVIRPYTGDGKTVTLLKTDVSEVLPDSRETVEFLALRSEAAIKTVLSPAQLAELLQHKIPAFESKYPETKYRPEVDSMTAGLTADQQKLAEGLVKISGVWLDHDQLNQEKYQVAAAIVQEAMASAEVRGDWISTLNAFQNLRSRFPFSRAYVDGIEIALRVLPQLRKLEEQKLQQYRLDLLRLKLSLTETPAHIRADLERADRRESESVEAAIADQRATGMRWPALFPRSEKGFEELYRQINEEVTILTGLPRNKYRESMEAAISAVQSLANRDLTAAESFLETAETAWPENEMIAHISTSLVQARQAAAVQPVKKPEPEQGLFLFQNYPRTICVAGALFCFILAAIIILRRGLRSRRRYIG